MTTSALTSLRVTLQDCIGIEHDIKAKAEARFAKVIERSFPNQEAMTRAYKLFNDAAEGGVIGKAGGTLRGDEMLTAQYDAQGLYSFS